jgi:hypothetical protein
VPSFQPGRLRSLRKKAEDLGKNQFAVFDGHSKKVALQKSQLFQPKAGQSNLGDTIFLGLDAVIGISYFEAARKGKEWDRPYSSVHY